MKLSFQKWKNIHNIPIWNKTKKIVASRPVLREVQVEAL